MIQKKKWDQIGSQLTTIAGHYQNPQLETEIHNTIKTASEFAVRALFVGHFSAGKSALLNSILKRPNFLREDQAPATAVATELYYDAQERLVVYDLQGHSAELSVNANIPNSNVDRAVYYLNNDTLQQLDDLTLVDTPGFDSGIENHDRALRSYLENGSFFVLVINAEKGTVDEMTIHFLSELSHYNNDLVVLLNKCDKLTSENAERVREEVLETLQMEGIGARVYCVSKYDDDLSENMLEILREFQVQSAFDQNAAMLYTQQIQVMQQLLKQQLEDFEDPDTFSLDRKIRQLQETEKAMETAFAKQKEQLENSIDEQVEELKSKLKSALIGCAGTVVKAASSGGSKAAEAVIMETLRPVLMGSFRELSIRNLDQLARDMDRELKKGESKENRIASQMKSTFDQTRDLIKSGSLDRSAKSLASTLHNKDAGKTDKQKKGESAYHAIAAGLAILTNFVSPWVEVAVVLAPEIIKLGKEIFGESDTARAQRIYIDSTVPQILSELHEPAVEAIRKSNEQTIAYLEAQLASKKEMITASIKETKDMKENNQAEASQHRENLVKDLKKLETLAGNLTTGGSAWH